MCEFGKHHMFYVKYGNGALILVLYCKLVSFWSDARNLYLHFFNSNNKRKKNLEHVFWNIFLNYLYPFVNISLEFFLIILTGREKNIKQRKNDLNKLFVAEI